MKIALSLEYRKIYPDQISPDYSELLEGIPSSSIMQILGFLNSKIVFEERNQGIQLWILNYFTQRLPRSIVQLVNEQVKGKNISFFNHQTSFILISKVLSNLNSHTSRALTPMEEENLFKAYLLSSQEWIDKQNSSIMKVNLNNTLEFAHSILPVQLAFSGIQENFSFVNAIYKSVSFFKFCENQERIKPYLISFFNEKGIASWKEYFNIIFGLVMGFLKNDRKSVYLTYGDKNVNALLDSFSVNLRPFNNQDDFITLREYPVFKLKDSEYQIISVSLLIGKFFNSFIFDFGRYLVAKGEFVDYPSFKSTCLSLDFFQNDLFTNAVHYIIRGRSRVKYFSDQDWEDKFGERGPDFTIQCGRKVFVIEFKDSLFNATAKTSYNLSLILAEIEKKMVRSDTGKKKGVIQLSDIVNQIVNEKLDIGVKHIKESIIIYPIIVYTDSAFSEPGINYLLKLKLNENVVNSSMRFVVRDLIMIELDTLLKFQDIVKDKKIPLQIILDAFIEYTDRTSNTINACKSFSSFIAKYLSEKSIKIEPIPRNLKKILVMEKLMQP